MSDLTYKIVCLEAENFKRLKAVRVQPGPGMVTISGRNAAGKTSLIDSIEAAFGGASHCPAAPVRAGESSARVVVDLGDIKVIRRFRDSGSSELVVESADGLTYRSPQAVLDKLTGDLTFDPLAFARMKTSEQARVLKDLAGLRTDDIERERDEAYRQRTEVGRQLKQAQAALSLMPDHPTAPDEPVSVADLTARHREAMATIRTNELARAGLQGAESAVRSQEERIEELRQKLSTAEATLADLIRARAKAEYGVLSLQPDPCLANIEDAIRGAETVNRQVAENQTRAKQEGRLALLRESQEELTARLDELKMEQERRLEAAKFPVPGLTVWGDEVQYQGQPLEQASQAERIKVGLAIGAALNPRLRVVLVRDGSLLDDDSMSELAHWADATDMQVFIERVADPASSPCGIVIEDGEVLGAPAPEAKPARRSRTKAAPDASLFGEAMP